MLHARYIRAVFRGYFVRSDVWNKIRDFLTFAQLRPVQRRYISLPRSCRFPFVPIDGYARSGRSLAMSACLTYGKRRTFVHALTYTRDHSDSYARKKDAVDDGGAVAYDHIKTCARHSPLVCRVILCAFGAMSFVMFIHFRRGTRNFGGNSWQREERRVRVAEIVEFDGINDRHRVYGRQKKFSSLIFPPSSVALGI